MAELEPIFAETIAIMKSKGNHCGRACAAGTGVCVGRSEADNTRPMIIFGKGRGQQIADLTVGKIDIIPEGCPFFMPADNTA